MTADVSTKGSFSGISLAGTVYNFDPVLDGDDAETLTSEIEQAILAAGYTYENGDVRVSKTSTLVTVSVYGSSLVFTAMKGVTADTNFSAANSVKLNVAMGELNDKGYLQK